MTTKLPKGIYINEQADTLYNLTYNKARKEVKEEIMEIINKDRDNGNITITKGFSPALCLSKIIKYCEEK